MPPSPRRIFSNFKLELPDLLRLLPLLLLPLLGSCGTCGSGPGVSYSSPQIINVSSYDPKEVQRRGDTFTPDDLTALRKNGAQGLIARTGKGSFVDPEAHRYLAAAKRAGLRLGTYHYYLPWFSPESQARTYVNRVRSISRQQRLGGSPILLVGDFHGNSTPDQILRFCRTVERLTGTRPLVYLEHSAKLKRRLSSAPERTKAALRRYPLWIALYSPFPGKNPDPMSPEDLVDVYDVWNDFALWQYGGVLWENRRSSPKHYRCGFFQAPRYFGSLAHPTERSVYKGSDLSAFWNRHSWRP